MLNKFGEVIENADLTNYNSYGIHAKTKYLIKPDNIDNLNELIKYLNSEKINYYILGGGTNIILPDNTFDGVIITLEKLNKLNIINNIVEAEAGIFLSKLVIESINNSLKGLEYLALIPGSLGGALYGNAGVKEYSIYDHLKNITVLRNNEIITIEKKDIDYSYRNTMFKKSKDIIIKATFKLDNGNIDELKDIVKENRIKRLNTQPLEYKNAGSVFKNPEGDFAGRLIESLNLKGFSIGDAKISEKHANFIVNVGNATSKDIKNLIKYIKDRVKEAYNIDLELEQIIVDWE